jgi:ribosome biogenesis GTPase
MTDYTLDELGWRPAFLQSLDLDHDALDDVVRISAVHRDAYEAIGPDGPMRLRMMPIDTPVDERPTVGDWVLVDRALERPARVLPRLTLFTRKAAGHDESQQLIAANVDVALIVTSCNGDFNTSRLERYLALVRDAGAFPVIVLTKADLVPDAEDFGVRARDIAGDCPVELLNARDLDDVRKLMVWMGRHQTLALLGSSGVGKTTLLNGLTGKSEAVSGIREDDAKGRHTTRGRSMHPLTDGGWAIDLPGMRELGLTSAHEGMDATFGDITELANHCRFSDCQHDQEPGCSVREAIDDGRLDEDRLQRFRKLEREIARNEASLAQRRAKDRNFSKLVRNSQTQRWTHRKQT